MKRVSPMSRPNPAWRTGRDAISTADEGRDWISARQASTKSVTVVYAVSVFVDRWVLASRDM